MLAAEKKHPVLVMRPSTASIVVMWSFVGLVFGILAVGAFRNPSGWTPAAVCLAIGVLGTLWFRSFRLDLDDDSLRYLAPLRPVLSIRLQDVTAARVEVGLKRYSDLFRPMLRLAITTSGSQPTKTYYVNMKVFRRADVDELLRILRRKGMTQ